jgi:phage terminase small subunit
MRYKTPIEIRQSQNIRVRTKLAEIPESMRCRIPVAEWSDKPESFCRMQFIEETSTFIDAVYSVEPKSYQTLLWMLSLEMQSYMDATIGFRESGGELVVGEKINPWVLLKFDATKNILRLQKELGLTPASRLSNTSGNIKSHKNIYDIIPFG